MTDINNRLVLQFDVRNSNQGANEVRRVTAAVREGADAFEHLADAYEEAEEAPSDMFADFADDVHEAEEAIEDLTDAQKRQRAEMERINRELEESARETREATAATKELNAAKKATPKTESERNAEKLASLADQEQKVQRQKIAVLQAQEQSQNRIAIQADAMVRAGQKELAIEQQKLALEIQAAAQGDEGIRNAQLESNIERERASNNARIKALSDAEIAAQRKSLAISQQQLATEVKLEQLHLDANKELATATAKQRELATLQAKVEGLANAEVQSLRETVALSETQVRAETAARAIANDTIRQALIEEAVAKERLAIAAKTTVQQNNTLQQSARELALSQRLNSLKTELAELGRDDIQAARGQVALERERLEIIDKIAEIEAGAGGGEFAQLKEKLRLLEQEKELKNDIQATKRLGDGGDLRELQDQRVLADVTRDHADEQARLNAILNDPAALKRAKQLHAMEQQLERSTMSFRDRIEMYADILEKTDSSLQVWFTIGMVLEKAFEVFTAGTLARGIEDATEKLGKLSSAAETYAGTQGLLTQTQSRQAALRGAEMGVGKQTQGALGGFAATLGQRAVALGEADNVGEATIEALRNLQAEFKSGELGQSFQDLGVSVAQYERAVRAAAAQKGVLPDALDRQTRQQILLAQATNDATGALALYGNEALRNAQDTKNFFTEVKEGLGRVVAGEGLQKSFGFDEADIASSEAERTRRAYEKSREKSELSRSRVGGVGGDSESTAASLERATAEAKIAHEQAVQKTLLAESFVLQRGINQELALKTEALLMTGEVGSRELLALNETFALERERRSVRKEIADIEAKGLEIPLALDMKLLDINQKLGDHLKTSKLISKEDFWQLQSKLTDADLQNIINEGKATQLTAAVKVADAEAKAAKHRLENTTIATKQVRLDEARLLAVKEFETSVLKELELQGKTFDEAQKYLGHAKLQNMMKLEGERAINAELIKRDKFMTDEHKQILTTRNAVKDLKLETLGLTDNAVAYHTTIGQAVAVQAFEKWGSGAKTLAEQFGIGDEALGKMVQKAGELAGVVDTIAGGGLFTDAFLERLFAPDKDKKDPTGAGGKGKKDPTGSKSKDDGLLEKLRRERIERQIADAAYLGEVTEEAYEHQKNFIEDNLKEVSKLYEATYGDMGKIDQTMRGQLARLEWAYADEMKQAGDNAEKQKFVRGALSDRLAELQLEMERRNATFFTNLEAGLTSYALRTKDSLGVASAAWQAHVKEFEVMQDLELTARKEMFDRANAFDADELTTGLGNRKQSDQEKDALARKSAMMKESQDMLSAHQWSADQRLVIEQSYQEKLYEIERQYDQARFDENQRLRDAMAQSAAETLAETQELMSHFSEEARSKAEAGQATFQGGLSKFGMSSANALDGAMASMIGYIDVLGQVDKMQTAMNEANANETAVIAKSVGGILAAAGKAADGVVKNEKWKAGIKGAVHTAESIGAFASQDYVGGTMHALAAAKFFVIAGTASESPAKAKKAEATKRTALSQSTVALSRDRGMTAWTQVFIQLHPITGEAMVSTMNDSARRGSMTGRALDSRLTRPTATVRTEV